MSGLCTAIVDTDAVPKLDYFDNFGNRPQSFDLRYTNAQYETFTSESTKGENFRFCFTTNPGKVTNDLKRMIISAKISLHKKGNHTGDARELAEDSKVAPSCNTLYNLFRSVKV